MTDETAGISKDKVGKSPLMEGEMAHASVGTPRGRRGVWRCCRGGFIAQCSALGPLTHEALQAVWCD